MVCFVCLGFSVWGKLTFSRAPEALFRTFSPLCPPLNPNAAWLRVQGSRFRVQGSGFRVLGCRVSALESKRSLAQDLGFRV